MPPTLELRDVSVSYGNRRALEAVSLSVGAGEIVTLLGANDAGKSTTLRAVSGLVRPARGRVLYDRQDVTRWNADAIVAAGLGHVPEGREVFAEFTVLDNLLVGAHTVPRRTIGERLEAAYRLFPVLRARRRQWAGTLSGGEQQMLAIARALMAQPNVRGALRLAARGYVLETGRVVASGTSAGLAVDPRIRSAYLGLDRPRPEATS